MAKYVVNKTIASFKAGTVIDLDKVPYALEAHVTKVQDSEKLEAATPKSSSKTTSKSTK